MASDSNRPARKRSQAVTLTVVGSLALALTSCSGHADERCVDTTNYKTVADKLCNNAAGHGYADTDRYQWYAAGGDSTHVHGYHRSYGSGSRGSGGSDDGSGSGHGISRGGFGGHGDGSGGG
ncbi:hypothetical protein [Streptacidiphilus anmyonensis]|uniref:hypothetical protein n=1 Tax=Streptacidiphilus anmyonensis TaxID=405782 RepID=UPI0005A9B4EB|nr:hypothetical protein [Streptacidiphilus anmyonensis]